MIDLNLLTKNLSPAKRELAEGAIIITVTSIGVALFIIGCLAKAGRLNGLVAGGCAVGLAAPLLALSLYNARKTKNGAGSHLFAAVCMLAIATIGALAIAKALPAHSVGTTVSCGFIALIAAFCCGYYHNKDESKKEKGNIHEYTGTAASGTAGSVDITGAD